ncbi:MAG: preprotein translocase subunit SecG [Alphaproteobacteria bacterium]|jgi:preprotein translocase subunit SecG
MTTILLVIHLFLAIGLVISILLQRSEGGALGIGGSGGGGGGGMMTARGQANFLTRVTAVLATGFVITSLVLAIVASQNRKPRSVIDAAPAVPTQGAPAKPGVPVAPLGR